MSEISNYLLISGTVLFNLILCLVLFYTAFKAWVWLSGEVRSRAEMLGLRIDLLAKKIGEIERNGRA